MLAFCLKYLCFHHTFIALIPQKLSEKITYENNLIVTEEDRKKHFGQKDHVRRYGLDFSQRLKDSGFYIKLHYIEGCEKYIKNMVYDEKYKLASANEKDKHGLIENNIIYECIKNKNVLVFWIQK